MSNGRSLSNVVIMASLEDNKHPGLRPLNCRTGHRLWLRWTLFGASLFTLFFLSPSQERELEAGMVAVAPYEVPPEKSVYVLPLDGLTEKDVGFIAEGIERRLGTPTALLVPGRLPSAFYQDAHGAYDANAALDWLFVHKSPDDWRVVGITSAPLTDGRRPLHGLASLQDGVAIVSLASFAQDLEHDHKLSRALAMERAQKAAIHEVVHTLGLPHCDDGKCLMRALKSHREVTPDTKLCAKCVHQIYNKLRPARDGFQEALDDGDGNFRRARYGSALEAYAYAYLQASDDRERRAESATRVGATLISMELVAEGESYVNEALRLDPYLPTAYYNLSLVRAYAGEGEEAEEALRKGMSLDPSATSRHGFAARFYMQVAGDPGAALLEYELFLMAGGRSRWLDAYLEANPTRHEVIRFVEGEFITVPPRR